MSWPWVSLAELSGFLVQSPQVLMLSDSSSDVPSGGLALADYHPDIARVFADEASCEPVAGEEMDDRINTHADLKTVRNVEKKYGI